MNRFPIWKNLLVAVVVLVGVVFSLPNLFDQDPSIEVAGSRQAQVSDETATKVESALKEAGIPLKRLERQNQRLLLRFADSGSQLRAQDLLTTTLGGDYTLAMNLVPDVPGWLRALGAEPMYLGLDLRGGIHVVIDVDIEAAVGQAVERYDDDIRGQLRQEKLRYVGVSHDDLGVTVKFTDAESRDKGMDLIYQQFPSLQVEAPEGTEFVVQAVLKEQDKVQVRRFALEQNITTLRNRVNALGVAEPVIQQQGDRRIVVQLPGVQDPSRLKELLGATATLEYRLQDTEHAVEDAVEGRVPPGSKLYKTREGQPILLKKSVIVTGNQITDASSGLDQRSGAPAVFVSLDGQGARRMRDVTTENTGKPMAVVFIENRTETKIVDGQPVKRKVLVEEVISVANILEPFGARFQTTGIDSSDEAHNLALLLRSGALAAPIEIVEERTIGPSLGQENIEQGFRAVVAGSDVVMIFMGVYYRAFGMIANVGLVLNLMLLVAILSMLQATLTLPGIAGILLTIGMAVDANVLINERIREELRIGNTPQASDPHRLRKGLRHHPGRQHHHPYRRGDPVQLRHRSGQGIRRGALHRHPHLHVHRHHRHPRAGESDLWRQAAAGPAGLIRRHPLTAFRQGIPWNSSKHAKKISTFSGTGSGPTSFPVS
jgi:preprotein translocase subunit SecD